MKMNPIFKFLRKVETKKGTNLLDILIKHLKDIEHLSASEIAAVLEISVGSVYKSLKKDKSS